MWQKFITVTNYEKVTTYAINTKIKQRIHTALTCSSNMIKL